MTQGMSAKKIARIIGVFLLFFVILGYGIWGAKYILFGIKLDILDIADGATIQTSPLEIHGISKRAKSININGEQIFIDPDGTFHDTRALVPGINKITISAYDKFGKGVTKKFSVYYPPPKEIETSQKIQIPENKQEPEQIEETQN